MPLGRFLSDVCDGIPIVGHVKGVIHDIAGDEKAAKRSYAAANRSTVVAVGGVAGGLVGGPVGGAAVAAYAGAMTDVVESAVTNKPVGIVGSAKRIAEARDLGDVILGVGQMSLDIVADAAAGASAGAAAKSIARQSTRQLLKSAGTSAAEEAGKQATGFVRKEAGKQATGFVRKEAGKQAAGFIRKEAGKQAGKQVASLGRKAAVAVAAQVVQKSRDRNSSDTTDLSDVSSLESSGSSSDEDEDEGFIYLFTCPDGSYKVGRTGRASVLSRLNEHRRNGLIKPHSDITVYECPRHVTRAEARILGEIQIYNARRWRQRRTEILDNNQVKLQHVRDVIRRVIAELNDIPPFAVRTRRYHYDSNKITQVF